MLCVLGLALKTPCLQLTPWLLPSRLLGSHEPGLAKSVTLPPPRPARLPSAAASLCAIYAGTRVGGPRPHWWPGPGSAVRCVLPPGAHTAVLGQPTAPLELLVKTMLEMLLLQ